jgi:hypothetical protein
MVLAILKLREVLMEVDEGAVCILMSQQSLAKVAGTVDTVGIGPSLDTVLTHMGQLHIQTNSEVQALKAYIGRQVEMVAVPSIS